MARRSISIEEKIQQQKEVVSKAKDKYEAALEELEKLMKKRDEIRNKEILDAIAHPEKHENLVVRIGGYSEYFNRLSPELKQTVLERTEY